MSLVLWLVWLRRSSTLSFWMASDHEITHPLAAVVSLQPELPISSCLDPSNAPSSTRAIVVSLTDAVNHPIKLTKPFLGVVS